MLQGWLKDPVPQHMTECRPIIAGSVPVTLPYEVILLNGRFVQKASALLHNPYAKTIIIPGYQRGGVLGYRGERLSDIKSESKADIKLTLSDDQETAAVSFRGLPACVDKAEELILAYVKDWPTFITHESAAQTFRMSLCRHFMNGTCTFGGGCRFAHSERELRPHTCAL